jgi:hypothetical protein
MSNLSSDPIVFNNLSPKICKFHLLYTSSFLYDVWVLCEILFVQPSYVIIEFNSKLTLKDLTHIFYATLLPNTTNSKLLYYNSRQ